MPEDDGPIHAPQTELISGRESSSVADILALSNLDQNQETHAILTSFTPTSEEVETYRQLIAEGTPTIAYEFLQNAMDYNDYERGLPQMELLFTNGRSLTYADFLSLSTEQLAQLQPFLEQIVITNHIKDEVFLSPEHLQQMRHGGGEGTLGEHGRGGKAGGAALIAEKDAAGIQYVSRDEHGSWRAQCEMSIRHDLFPHQKNPSYNIEYQYFDDPTDSLDQTVVMIKKPSLRFLHSLRKIPQIFLPVNPQYQDYRLENDNSNQAQPNLFTVYVELPTGTTEGVTFTAEEISQKLGIRELAYTEPPRVEILPPDIVDRTHQYNGAATMSVCVDGLSLRTYSNYLLQWSFWGCDKGEHGYRAKRSHDSRMAEGHWSNLMVAVLGKCTNPAVFTALFEAFYKRVECEEAKLPAGILEQELEKSPAALQALTTAWEQFRQAHDLPKECLVTAAQSFKDQAEKKNSSVVLLQSETFVRILEKFKLASRAEMAFMFESRASATGDVFKIPREDFAIHDQVDLLFDLILKHQGVLQTATDGQIVVKLDYQGDKLPRSYHDLPAEIDQLIKKMSAAVPEGCVIKVYVDLGPERATRFEASSERPWGQRDNVTVNIASGEAQSVNAAPHMRVVIEPTKKEEVKLAEFTRVFYAEFAKVSADGQTIDLDLFQEQYSGLERGAFDVELIKKKRELEALENAMRERMKRFGIVLGDEEGMDATRTGIIIEPLRVGEQRIYTTLFQPDSDPDARNSIGTGGFVPGMMEQLGIGSLLGKLQLEVEALEHPDLHLLNPTLLPAYARTTLIATVNPKFSGELQSEPVSHIEIGPQPSQAGVRLNKMIAAGTRALPLPPQTRLVGLNHPSSDVSQVVIRHSANHNTYSISSEVDIPAGLELYVEYDEATISTQPASARETEPLVDLALLDPPWRGLVEAVQRDNQLTDKQKLDIALTAWLHAFTYDKDPRIDAEFEGLEGAARYSKIINLKRGNCGYVTEGFVALCRAFGLPATETLAYLGDRGRFFPGPHNHAQARILLSTDAGQEWVDIEPQRGYLSQPQHFSREQIPARYKAMIRRIERGVMQYDREGAALENTGIVDVYEELKRRELHTDPGVVELLRTVKHLREDQSRLFDEQAFIWMSDPSIPGGISEIGQPQPANTFEQELALLTNETNRSRPLTQFQPSQSETKSQRIDASVWQDLAKLATEHREEIVLGSAVGLAAGAVIGLVATYPDLAHNLVAPILAMVNTPTPTTEIVVSPETQVVLEKAALNWELIRAIAIAGLAGIGGGFMENFRGRIARALEEKRW